MSYRKVLDYHDVLLYADDIELLRGQQWLNDQAGIGLTLDFYEAICPCKRHGSATALSLQVIAFYFEYLSREKHGNKDLSFCPGSLTFLLLHSGDQCCDDSLPTVLACVNMHPLTEGTLRAP